MTCWDQLGAVLSWEGQDADLQSEHFLLVACYNLQHPLRFTDEALKGLRTIFVDYMDNDIPPRILRRRVLQSLGQEGAVLRKGQPSQDQQRQEWSLTIADVYDSGLSTGAAERVRRWAQSIRSQLEPR